MPKTFYYASTGPDLTLYDLDVEGAALTRRGATTLPENIQYAWVHPSRPVLYVVSSNGGPSGLVGDTHCANALAIDPASGALRAIGTTVRLAARPIHASVDRSGNYLLIAYNIPSSVTVHRLNSDGTIGAEVPQNKLDTGIYAHQILAAPGNKAAMLVTRGNDEKPGKPEDPGSIRTFSFDDGTLKNLASVAPGTGLGFGPRHLDFHPNRPWVFVSIERQNQLYVYERNDTAGIARDPIFVKNSLANPKPPVRQAAGAIHVHPNGRFVYQTNRASDLTSENGETVVVNGENNIAVYAIDQTTGEPTLVQNADGKSYELRTFGIDPSGRVLVVASIKPAPVRQSGTIVTVPARISVYRIAADGQLAMARQYDVDTGRGQQFWSGMVTVG